MNVQFALFSVFAQDKRAMRVNTWKNGTWKLGRRTETESAPGRRPTPVFSINYSIEYQWFNIFTFGKSEDKFALFRSFSEKRRKNYLFSLR